MAGTSNKLMLPTGFESDQRNVERQRKLAEVLLGMSMQTQQQPMRSWTQPIAAIVQAWKSGRLNKKADRAEDAYRQAMLQKLTQSNQNFDQTVASGASPQQITSQFAMDPYVQDRLDPYAKALTSRLQDDQKLIKHGPKYVRQGELDSGSLVPNDPNAGVIYGADGSFQVNPVKMTASLGAQGLEMINPVTSMQDPRAMGAPALPPMPEAPAALPTAPEVSDPNRNFVADSVKRLNGKTYFQVNGQWFEIED